MSVLYLVQLLFVLHFVPPFFLFVRLVHQNNTFWGGQHFTIDLKNPLYNPL